MSDREQIQDLMARYALALDTFDAEGYGAVFTEDAMLDIAGKPYQGRAEIAGFVDELKTALMPYVKQVDQKGRHFAPVRHIISNFVIDIQGDSATADSYFSEILSEGRSADGRGLPQSILNVGRYQDDLVKRDGRWLIARRLIVSDMYGKVPPGDFPAFPQQAGPSPLSD